MSLDRAISSGKERRRPYRDSRRFDYACRNHGGCPACERARTINQRRTHERARDAMRDAT